MIKIIYLTNINNIYYNNYNEHMKIRFIKFWQWNIEGSKKETNEINMLRNLCFLFHQQIKIKKKQVFIKNC